MEQEKLEQKVREIWERQGFQVIEQEDRLIAEKESVRKKLQVFSSEKYGPEELEKNTDPEALVFVDESLSEAQKLLDNEVSTIKEEKNEKEYNLPSYELIGDIAVINDLVDRDKDEAVEGILHHHPHVKTVLLKSEGLEGEFRVGEYEKLYGEETETVHTEFGCDYKVDPTQVYFSERFGTERERVVDQIEEWEKVLVMFAGVGPFAILAAKRADPEQVVAVEKNPLGADYLKENIELNNVGDTVEGIEGDVAEIVPGLGKFDRIIMPLPEAANQFLQLAFEHLKENGIIHYYRFMENEEWKPLLEEIEEAASEKGVGYEIMDKVVCGQRAPDIDRVCIEIKRK